MQKIYLSNKDFFINKEHFIIVDVRTEYEYRVLSKIENSKNIPLDNILKNLTSISSDKKAYICFICNGGNRSAYAAETFRNNGYINSYVLETGIYGYTKYLKKIWKK